MPPYVHFKRMSLKWQTVLFALVCLVTIPLFIIGTLIFEFQRLSSQLESEANKTAKLLSPFSRHSNLNTTLNQIRQADNRIDQIHLSYSGGDDRDACDTGQ